jgi:hypothetical protein
MALQHSITLESGIECPNAYTRIDSLQHTHDETVVEVQTWSSASTRQALKAPICQRSYSITWAASVSIEYAYNQLKTLPEYEDALDV